MAAAQIPAEDAEDLVDLSVSPRRMPEEPSNVHVRIPLHRNQEEESWGFRTYRLRFPMTVGSVDTSRAPLLRVGDRILAINDIPLSSLEMGATLLSRGRDLVLIVQRDCVESAAAVSADAMKVREENSRSQNQRPDAHQTFLADLFPPTLKGMPKCRIDLILTSLLTPKRDAVYTPTDCPLGPEIGVDEAMHASIAKFLADACDPDVSSEKRDLQFDAISAMLGTGNARTDDDLWKFIQSLSTELTKRAEKNRPPQAEITRCLSFANKLRDAAQTSWQSRQEKRERFNEFCEAADQRLKEFRVIADDTIRKAKSPTDPLPLVSPIPTVVPATPAANEPQAAPEEQNPIAPPLKAIMQQWRGVLPIRGEARRNHRKRNRERPETE